MASAIHQLLAQAALGIQRSEQRLAALRMEIVGKNAYLAQHQQLGGEEEEVEFVVEEDTLKAMECEQRGEMEAAKQFHLSAFDKLIQIDPPTESSARGLAAFASFAVRNLDEGVELDEEQISEAFDCVGDFPAVAASVECERAVFLGFTLGDSPKAWESFKLAKAGFPEDVQLLCNYARFVDSVLVQEAEEDGDLACIPELKELASELYVEALEIDPAIPSALVNLSAIYVEQSREKALLAERTLLLEQARALLLSALKQGEERAEMAMMHYNLACIECLLEGKASPECATHLKKAVGLDPSLRGAIVQDPDLSSVRHEKWCLALLK
ncbi:hypothetical protein BASA81_010043 [Batrachochytrium salamandrivorans]|nr:hypothetical protein BASA81_010043 [Batrachochytrium salamandrivorans]